MTEQPTTIAGPCLFFPAFFFLPPDPFFPLSQLHRLKPSGSGTSPFAGPFDMIGTKDHHVLRKLGRRVDPLLSLNRFKVGADGDSTTWRHRTAEP